VIHAGNLIGLVTADNMGGVPHHPDCSAGCRQVSCGGSNLNHSQIKPATDWRSSPTVKVTFGRTIYLQLTDEAHVRASTKESHHHGSCEVESSDCHGRGGGNCRPSTASSEPQIYRHIMRQRVQCA
jgi:hypothetical protein